MWLDFGFESRLWFLLLISLGLEFGRHSAWQSDFFIFCQEIQNPKSSPILWFNPETECISNCGFGGREEVESGSYASRMFCGSILGSPSLHVKLSFEQIATDCCASIVRMVYEC